MAIRYSGFARDDDWGYRSLEPTRTVISSIALVLLKTGIHHPEDPNNNNSSSSFTGSSLKGADDSDSSDDDDEGSETDSLKREKERMGDAQEDQASTRVTIDQAQMSTAQKLLLFWRKPAVSPSSSRLGSGVDPRTSSSERYGTID